MNTMIAWSSAVLIPATSPITTIVDVLQALVSGIVLVAFFVLRFIVFSVIPTLVFIGIVYVVFCMLELLYRFVSGLWSDWRAEVRPPAPDPYRQMDALSDAYLDAVAHRLARR